MKNTALFFLIIFSLLSCKGQQKCKLEIVNQSSTAIDSISFAGTNPTIIQKVAKNERQSFEIKVPDSYASEETPLFLTIHQGMRTFTATWGFCDFGVCRSNNKPIYLFGHGISYLDQEPQMPKEFVLNIINMTKAKIDSVYTTSDVIIKSNNYDANSKQIILSFSKFKDKPLLTILAGKEIIANLSYFDWDNWNNSGAVVYLYKDGIHQKKK